MYIYILRPNILSTHPIYAFCHVNISQKNTNISLHFRIEADQYALLVTDFLAKNVINVIAKNVVNTCILITGKKY